MPQNDHEYFNDAETREKLEKLRGEIVLNSLFTSDFENSFDIDASVVQDFFDGYLEFLAELSEEDYENGLISEDISKLSDQSEFLERYDNIDTLENWYDIVIGSGCAAFEL